MSLVSAMLAGVGGIDDTNVLRHGAMRRVFTGMRAPSTLGSFLRALAWGLCGNPVRRPRVHLRAGRTLQLLPGSDQVVYLDLDSKVKKVYGTDKQGAEHGYTKVICYNDRHGRVRTGDRLAARCRTCAA
ncbi:hypothetical protein [Streptomyces sp. NPDC005209]|uniref:hypothetical protein n=1 Tax=Streptomyces sp. NPDC005209 TaxID=3156715 RepID=UPI0033BDA03A